MITLSQRGYDVCEIQLASWGHETSSVYRGKEVWRSTGEPDWRGRRVGPPAPEER